MNASLLAALILATGGAAIAEEPYGAVGTEPFWGLGISADRLEFDVTGWPEYTYSAPLPPREATARGYRYRTSRLVVDIWRADCSDGMTDRRFADTVVVRLDGRQFEGCGGEILPPDTLDATSWELVDAAGVPGDNELMEFLAGGVYFELECLAAPYSRTGDVLTFEAITTNRDHCVETDSRLEQSVRTILSAPVTITFPDPDSLVLTGRDGAIRLRRRIRPS